MRPIVRAAAVAMALVLLPSSAWSEAPSPAELFRQAVKLYKAGRYRSAITLFERAAAKKPSPKLIYNIARCHDKLNNIKQAVVGYQRYLDELPDAPNRPDVEARITVLKKRLPPEPKVEEHVEGHGESEVAPAAPEPAATPPSAEIPSAGNPVPPAAAPQGAKQKAPSAEPEHEAVLGLRGEKSASPSMRPPAAQPPRRDRPAARPPKVESTPFYKTWWFWVGCAAAATITGFIIATAVTDNEPTTKPPSAAPRGLGISF